jgi:hypothetical protein
VGSGAITDGETDAKNASVDGPLRRSNMNIARYITTSFMFHSNYTDLVIGEM